MATNKRERLSTITEQVRMAQALQQGIEPTEALTPAERAVFDKLIQARESSTWTPHDVTTATVLARQIVQHAQLVDTVAREGVMINHPKKGLIAHPAIAASVSLAGAIKSQTTTLGLSASQRGVAGSRQQVRNQHEQAMRGAFSSFAHDDGAYTLLA